MSYNQESSEYLQKLNEAIFRIRMPQDIGNPVKVEFEYEGEAKQGVIVWNDTLKQFVIDEKGTFYPLIGFDFPKEGGVLVYWKGIEKPTKVFPYKDTVETIDSLKKVAMALVRTATDMVRRKPVLTTIFFVLFRKEAEILFKNVVQELHWMLRDIKNKPEMFSPVTREFYRVFSLKEGKIRNQMRDIFCHMVDYDDFYRYMLQAGIAKLSKKNLKKKPLKEIHRLLDILYDMCEDETVMKPKWKKIKTLSWILWFRKDMLKEVQEFLLELDLKKVKMDDIDMHHATKKPQIKWEWLKNDKS